MTQEQVIAKIKKLLELASSPNTHEANLAMEKAQRLMQEYCIETAQLRPDEQKIVQHQYKPPFVMPGFEFFPSIANSIAPLFGGAVLTNGKHEIFIYAFPTNYVVIAHALDCILQQGREDCIKGFRQNPSISFLPSFWNGFATAIHVKFKKLSPETGIELWDAAKAYAMSLTTGTSIGINSYSNQAGLAGGTTSGQSATIRPGVQPQFGGYLK